MRLIEIVYSHAQFDELPPERIFAPLGLDVYTECYEHPGLDTPADVERYGLNPTAYINGLHFDPPEGFVEVARYENEDNIVLLALKPLTPLAELLLAQEETGEALAAIARERRRQVEAEGWTEEHDDEHNTGEIAGAACTYAWAAYYTQGGGELAGEAPAVWPWEDQWFKPSDGPTRNLEKAGALTLAEMERIARVTHTGGAA